MKTYQQATKTPMTMPKILVALRSRDNEIFCFSSQIFLTETVAVDGNVVVVIVVGCPALPVLLVRAGNLDENSLPLGVSAQTKSVLMALLYGSRSVTTWLDFPLMATPAGEVTFPLLPPPPPPTPITASLLTTTPIGQDRCGGVTVTAAHDVWFEAPF